MRPARSVARSPLRRWGLNALVVLVGLGVTCGLLEIVLRTTHLFGAKVSWSTPDPLIAYRFVAGARYWFNKENDHPIHGRINSHGWRDRDWVEDGARRIAVLGDSYVEAFQVESDSTFLNLTERQLQRQHGLRTELMNFGRSGVTQTEQLLILRRDVLPLEPELVVVCFLPGNDIADVARGTTSNAERPFFVPGPEGELRLDTSFNESRAFALKKAIDPFKRRSALISFTIERLKVLRASLQADGDGADVRHPDAEPARGTLRPHLTLGTHSPDAVYARNYALNKRLIGEIAAECAASGIEVLLLNLDSAGYALQAESELRAVEASFDPFFFEKDLQQLAAALDVHYLSLQTVFREASQQGRDLHWVHWNYEGHRVVAQAVTARLGVLLAP